MKLKIGTYKKGAVYSSAFSIGSKLTAFVMQLLIAYYLGQIQERIFIFIYLI